MIKTNLQKAQTDALKAVRTADTEELKLLRAKQAVLLGDAFDLEYSIEPEGDLTERARALIDRRETPRKRRA